MADGRGSRLGPGARGDARRLDDRATDLYHGNQRWAVWAIGPRPGLNRQFPAQIEGTGSTQAEALTNLAAKLRRNGR